MSCDLCIFVRRIDLLKQAIRPGVLQKSRCIWSQDVVKHWTWQASCPPFFCVHHLLSSPNSMASLRPRDMSALTCTWMIYDQPLEKMWTWGGIMYFRRFTHGSSIRGMWRCRMKKIVFFLCNRWKLRHLLISDILSNSRTNLSTSESALPWIACSRETWWPTATFHLYVYNCTWKAISV